MEKNVRRPAHIVGGIVLFGAGMFLALSNMLYVVEFIKGVAQPVLILVGLTALATGIFRKDNAFRKLNIILGIILLSVGIYGVYDEYYATMDFINGVTPIFLVVAGLAALAHGIKQIKSEN
jgi:hypothetical protein